MKPKSKKTVVPIPDGVTLPPKFTGLRPVQAIAIDEIMAAYEGGARVVFLDAPVGAGKTIIAEAVRQLLGKPALYMCSTKSLQDQFVADFPHANVLKGRGNYTPTHVRSDDVSCEDCDKRKVSEAEYECTHCDDVDLCPYSVAKTNAVHSELAVMNSAYFLAETQNVEASSFDDRGLAIIDEGDLMEGTLMRQVEFLITRQVEKDLRLNAPKKGSHKTTIQAWINDDFIPAIRKRIKGLGSGDIDTQRLKRKYSRLLDAAKEIDLVGNDYWVRETKTHHPLVMKPYRVHLFGQDRIWSKADKWLVMSGTLFPEVDAPALGLEDGEWDTVTVPMTFPAKNRPIIFASAGKMTQKEKEKTLPLMGELISGIARRHPDENILVHTVSYNLAESLYQIVKSDTHRVFTYSNSNERDHAITLFEQEDQLLMLAPSLDRGIDLEGDKCGVQVVAKIPYPYLGDALVSARMKDTGGDLWYCAETARSLIQSTGRAIRTPTDTATTYILDGSYGGFLNRGGQAMLPKWWLDVVQSDLARNIV